VAQPRPEPRAALVQRGFARRQPGARRADERVAKTGIVPDPGENRIQGNRSRLSLGFATEFNFNRRLIEEKRVPDDVWLQVLVQAREDLIERTVESLVGARKVIIHLYNSTSPAQRRVVFGKSKEEIKAIAVQGARMIKDRLPRLKGTKVLLQYSPRVSRPRKWSTRRKSPRPSWTSGSRRQRTR